MNRIINPEFATDTSGWFVSNASDVWQDLSSTPGPTGGLDNYGAKITSNTAANSSLSQSVSGLTAGKWFRTSIRGYAPNANVASNALMLRAETDAWSSIITKTINTENVWQTLTLTGRVPTDGKLRTTVRNTTTTAGDTIYIDAVYSDSIEWADLFKRQTVLSTPDAVVAMVTGSVNPDNTTIGVALNLDSFSAPTNGVYFYTTGYSWKVDKIVNGTITNLYTSSGVVFGTGGILKAVKRETGYKFYYNGTLLSTITITDASIINNVRHAAMDTGSTVYYTDVFVLSNAARTIYYVDPSVSFDGNGERGKSASAVNGPGAFASCSPLYHLIGDLGQSIVALRQGATIEGNLRLSGAYNFIITSYGTEQFNGGLQPTIDCSRQWSKTWVQEGNLWYCPIDSGKAYQRTIIIDGIPHLLCTNKAGLKEGYNLSWYDGSNGRHYIRSANQVDPNTASVRVTDNTTSQYYGVNCTSTDLSNVKVYNVKSQYAYNSNIAMFGGGSGLEVAFCQAYYAGGYYAQDGIIVYGPGSGSYSTSGSAALIHDNVSNGNLNNGLEMWAHDGAKVWANDLSGNGGSIELWGYVTGCVFALNDMRDNTINLSATASPNTGRGLWQTGAAVSVPITGNSNNNACYYNVIGPSSTVDILASCGSLRLNKNVLDSIVYEGKLINTNAEFEHISMSENVFNVQYNSYLERVFFDIDNADHNVTINTGLNTFINDVINSDQFCRLNGTEYATIAALKAAISRFSGDDQVIGTVGQFVEAIIALCTPNLDGGSEAHIVIDQNGDATNYDAVVAFSSVARGLPASVRQIINTSDFVPFAGTIPAIPAGVQFARYSKIVNANTITETFKS